MNILNKFTARSLRLNKKRTIVTVIGIILSTALICATAGLISSFQETLIKRAITTDGDYHVAFMQVPENEQKYITQNRNVSEYMITKGIGYSVLEGGKNEFKPYVYITGYDETALEKLPLFLQEGRLPQNSNEILISEHIITNGEVDLKVGDKLKLKVGKRYSQGYELNQNNPCYMYSTEERKNVVVDEYIKEEFEKEYTIVGIIPRPSYRVEGYEAPGYTVITVLDNREKVENANIYVKYTDAKDTYEITKEINGEEEKYSVKYNTELLTWLGVSQQDNTQSVLYGIAAIVIGIIIVSSVFVIRNSFSISVTEKYKQYGILASIGATPKQIKHNVLFEGFLIAIIAIPLGVLSAMLAVWVLIMILNGLIGEFANITFIYKVSVPAIAISVVMSIVTIYLSCILPARKAKKISPIDAIRSTNDIRIKAKKIKSPKIIKKIFKIGGELSWKNLKRSKKKYRTTVISIFVSIVIFLSLSSVLQYGFKISGIYYEQQDHNIVVYLANNKEERDEIRNQVLKLDNIEKYSIAKTMPMYISVNEYSNKNYPIASLDEHGEIYIAITTVNQEEYARYLKKLGLSEKKVEGKALLYDKATYYKEDEYYEVNQTKIQDGENIVGNIYLPTENSEKATKATITIQVEKRVEELPMGVSSYVPTLIVNEEMFNQIQSKYNATVSRDSQIYIYSDKAYELEKAIEDLGYKDKIQISNLEEVKRENDAMILIVYIFLYGFISVITLIGVTNIFNTITTNMTLRSKEFAMLKSIGMTQKEFNRMIRLESIFYGAKALIYGLPVGIGLSYWIYTIIIGKYKIAYQIPYLQIALCVVFVFAIVFITMKYSLSKINKQNIIETIRNENI